MRKILFATVIIAGVLVSAQSAQAQVKFGVKVGLNVSSLDYEGWDDKDNDTGFFVGPMLDVTIPLIGIGVDGALMYSQRGGGDYKQSGLEIPINLKYNIGLGSILGVYIAVGPDFFFNFKDVKVSGVEKEDCQVGLNLGAGVKLLKHFQVGVNYQWGLNSTFEYNGDYKTNTWQVALAYFF